jgi:uncharacterized protein YkwD
MKLKIKTLIICLLIIMFVNYSSSDASQETIVRNATAFLVEEEVNKALLLALVNSARQKGCYCGDEYFKPTTPVVWNDVLEYAALMHSIDMQSHNFFSHTGNNGSKPDDRITRAGYIWYAYGENIFYGRETEEEVTAGWLASPGHCKNIMNPMYKEMGVARSGNYWTQIIASKRE